jgi:ABC-type multidrug transport system fused ATPase/permease subunit
MKSLAIQLIKNYARKNILCYIHLFITILIAILRVIISSFIYREFLDENIKNKFPIVIKHICYLWMSLFILYIIVAKTESILVTDISMYVRKEIIQNYLKTNEIFFSEKDVEKDKVKILDFGFLSDKILMWTTDIIIPNLILIVLINTFIFYKSPIVGLINLTSNILIFYLTKHYFSKIIDVINKRHHTYDKLSTNIGENLLNLMNIHLNDKIDYTIDKTDNLLNDFRKIITDMKKTCSDFIIYVKSIFYSFTFLSIIATYKFLNIKDFFQVFTIFTLYIPFFENFIDQFTIKMFYLADYISLGDYFVNTKKVLTDDNGNLITKSYDNYKYNIENASICKGNILFKNVSFSYEKNENNENNNIINKLNLSINSRERIGIISKSGNGKTTLMKLLLAFYKPQEGEIILDGININDIHPKLLRKQINYINQNTLLINDTIINNIKFGNDKKSDQEIINMIKKYDLISVFKDQNLNKIVEVSGKNMSMGMQKIIFILRGILKDSCVYIFDEPLTSLDEHSRKSVIKMIDDNTKNKTLIVITHDKEILSILNRIIEL